MAARVRAAEVAGARTVGKGLDKPIPKVLTVRPQRREDMHVGSCCMFVFSPGDPDKHRAGAFS
jgi:hypothetical protein